MFDKSVSLPDGSALASSSTEFNTELNENISLEESNFCCL